MASKTIFLAGLIVVLLGISSILVYYLVDAYGFLYSSQDLELAFYSNEFDESKTTIFLVGNSQVWRVNMTYINDEIKKFCEDCEVYNLGVAADSPRKRIKTLNPMIELKPDLVIYGIGYADVGFKQKLDNEAINPIQKPDSILPDPEILFQKEIIFPNFPNGVNPKFFSLNIIKNMFEKSEPLQIKPDPYDRPFKEDKDFKEKDYLVFENEELIKKFNIPQEAEKDFIQQHQNINSLKKIIQKFQDEDIQVSVYTVPAPRLIFDLLSEEDEKFYVTTIEEISKDFKINNYYLHEKFIDSKIFSDPIHVTLDEAGMPYTKEVFEIIKNEVLEL